MYRNVAIVAAVAPLLLLSACGTPQERCISRNTDEYRTISNLLSTVEGNLARGYAWEEREVVRTRLTECRAYTREKDGAVTTYYEPCWRDYVDTERYRVPIDPLAEQRRRDNLAARKAALSGRTAEVIKACKAAFPEES